jgi:hypothetical protein
LRDDIGKSAPSIDPKLPLIHAYLPIAECWLGLL